MPTPLGKALRKYRVDHDMSLATFAEKLGVSSSFVCLIEAGRRKPTPDLIARAARVFELDDEAQKDLLLLATGQRGEIVISVGNDRIDRDLATGFALAYPRLKRAQKMRICEILAEAL